MSWRVYLHRRPSSFISEVVHDIVLSMNAATRKPIRFRFSPDKAKEAISWMLAQGRALDLHTILKAFYFADVDHLNRYGRPIVGATYRAMKFGPVPIEVYEMLKGDPLWLAELGIEFFPWKIEGYTVRNTGNEDVNVGVFSETDFECLKAGFARSVTLSFNARTAATHDRAWQAANLGFMRYEDMLDDTTDRNDRISYLRESAALMRL